MRNTRHGTVGVETIGPRLVKAGRTPGKLGLSRLFRTTNQMIIGGTPMTWDTTLCEKHGHEEEVKDTFMEKRYGKHTPAILGEKYFIRSVAKNQSNKHHPTSTMPHPSSMSEGITNFYWMYIYIYT